MGKNELARKYAIEYYKHYNNVIWINAKTQESLKKLFQELAEELKIRVKEKRDKKLEERDIKSIVNDVYEYFHVINGLFIFDNAKGYKDINEFLPSSFSSFSGDEKLYILITSRNQEWKENIEVLPLDVFTSKEATKFIKEFLKIISSEQDKNIKELVEKLQYYPLSLRQVLLYIEDRNEKLKLRGEKSLRLEMP
ncbi:NB-ARC domain-containing protein [Wolbachia endosymbiont of Tettigetta isshikii]|uniref:NB-ARC domain-containing protein n=1 Tax=Wolbachia endosymbiont of Tettigetta isshikii TaxID=3239093 RepID=UPI00397FE3D6